MSQLRVNLRTQVNNASIRHEKRGGKAIIIVPSATLPDNVVMNRILYPADVIAEGYESLDKTPAPFGHPFVNNQYVSASSPEAINNFYVGAWNENVRRINGRVFLDKIIDVEVAQRTQKGRDMLAAIEAQKPIHTSTGLMLTLDKVSDQADYDYIATSMHADHDAILLNELGAATPAQGVGLFVNAKGEPVDVQNAELELDDNAIESIAESIAYQLEHEAREQERQPLIDKIMAAIKSLLGTKTTEGLPLSANQEGQDMTEAQIKEMQDSIVAQLKANTLSADAVKAIVDEAIAPVAKHVTELQTNAKAADEAARAALVDVVVKANLMDEADTAGMTINALQKLAAKCKPGAAAPLFAGFAPNADDKDALSDELPGGDA